MRQGLTNRPVKFWGVHAYLIVSDPENVESVGIVTVGASQDSRN
jgi:hypothetical protein